MKISREKQDTAMTLTEKPDTLFLFTAFAPFGKYEIYIKNELQVLASSFKQIHIFPMTKNKGEMWKLPSNVYVANLDISQELSSLYLLSKYQRGISKAMMMEYVILDKWGKRLRNFKQKMRILLNAARKAEALERWMESQAIHPEQAVFYSNWFDGWANSLALLKSNGRIPSFICRAHGYDLYPSRRSSNYIFFRSYQIESVDKVVCISAAGHEFLRNAFPQHKEKVALSYMGVFDRGLSPIRNSNKIQVLSCSNLIPLKRVHLIVEIIRELEEKVHWVHFGSGPLEEEIKSLAQSLPNGVSFEFSGRIPNEELLDYYANNHLDFLINASESEGLPVSIMEAASMGIPTVATDVGGTREIVNDQTGLLIPESFDPKVVAAQIKERIETWRKPEYREGVREFWKENFDAERNFQSFIEILKTL